VTRSSFLVIRGYTIADRDAVNAVAQAAFAQYSADYEDWPSFIEGIGRMADLALDADVLVAEQDGVIVGAVAHLGPGRPRATFFPEEWSVIRMLVVDPRRRGQGAGRALVDGCLHLAQQCGAPAIGLHTSPVMASALRMYEAIGFVRDQELPPIRGVPYARYMLVAAEIPTALCRSSFRQ
jgi:ribosomal protein S18 acetylase RimI-like enzyme